MNEKLEKAKEIIAKELNYKDWETCINDQPNYKIEGIMDKVAERYHELMDEWISIDTPPTEPNEDWYLVARNEDVFVMAHTYTKGNWYGYGNVYLTEDITHYKKLPTPPKQ